MKLFFYGVLMGDVAPPRVQELLAGIGPGQPATVRGTLYAVPDPRGAYPVLLPGSGLVHGRLHEAGRVNIAALDRFEGVDPDDPLAGEYRREEVEALDAGGARHAVQAYLWNREPDARLERVASGDFASWLAQSGQRAFGH
ncbi:MAG: gamma-glutamylcyclotransferase [Sphingomonadaceae bacterium]|nr:gamma-glutamylcyclotransferase [Sphingomonadaceae bacterium]